MLSRDTGMQLQPRALNPDLKRQISTRTFHVLYPLLFQPLQCDVLSIQLGFPGGLVIKESTCKVGDLGSIPGLGRSPEGGRINSSQIFLPGESPPWTEEPGCEQAMGSQRLRHDLVTKSQQI